MAICRQYASVFENDEALKPRLYVEKDWTTEEYSGGCYVSIMPPGVMTELYRQSPSSWELLTNV